MKKTNVVFKICIIMMIFTFIGFGNDIMAIDFWDQATNWYKPGATNTYLDANVIDDIGKMVEIIGTAVIAIATVVLGIKYVLGSVTDKAEVKDGMVTL